MSEQSETTVTVERRYVSNLQRLNQISRELLAERSIDFLLQRIVDEAKELALAAFSALVVLRTGSETEIQHFAYNAPRELFPDQLPRAVGLLAAPLRQREPMRIADIRGHEKGVGIPVDHPPIAALLAVPVVADNKPLGVLAVGNAPGQPEFTPLDETVLTELAAHTAMALTMAWSRAATEETEAERRHLRSLALHNIRTPLTVAMSSTELLRDGEQIPESERNELFDLLQSAHVRIHRLAEGALLQGVEADEVQAEASEIDVRALVDALLGDLQSATREKGVDVAHVAEQGAPGRIRGNPVLTRYALDRLVRKAIEHSPPGGRVVVTSRLEGECVRFDVTDRGPGMPLAEQSQLLQPASRPSRPLTSTQPAEELPLSMVRWLVERQGGTVGVTSRPQDGTTFWVTFPIDALWLPPEGAIKGR